MLTVDASSNPYQIWTASLMRWARKAPSPSDEGQAHRLAARMDTFLLLQCAWSRNSIPMDPPFQCLLADSIPIAGRKIHGFPICCQQLMLSASPRAPARLWPTWAVTAQSMLNDGTNHPKHGWKIENMSQTTNHLTIAAFFRPTRSDRKKNAPAI